MSETGQLVERVRVEAGDWGEANVVRDHDDGIVDVALTAHNLCHGVLPCK